MDLAVRRVQTDDGGADDDLVDVSGNRRLEHWMHASVRDRRNHRLPCKLTQLSEQLCRGDGQFGQLANNTKLLAMDTQNRYKTQVTPSLDVLDVCPEIRHEERVASHPSGQRMTVTTHRK